ncbi:hypothetical protein BC834DRAFT_890032 [Gloeopeniophorella convolvens]|nr:hypothetical protein BC834DRAFT_890032 [Gloeopeniophorella convolvens]
MDKRTPMGPLYESAVSYWSSCFQKRRDILEKMQSLRVEDGAGSRPGDSTNVLRAFDDEIGTISKELQLLKAQRNAVPSPISRLSLDILLLIFELLRDDSVADVQQAMHLGSYFRSYSTIRADPDLKFSTNLGYIRWRQIFLSEPILWRHIILDLGPEWLRTFLSRSRSIPKLSFFGKLPSNYHTTLDSTFDPIDFTRASLLSVEGYIEYSRFTSFLNNFDLCAPDLRSIELCLTFRSFPPVPVPEPPSLNLLTRSCPRLQRISICDIPVSWQPLQPPIHSLTSLEIIISDSQPHSIQPAFCVTNVIGFLKGTPALEVLVLRWCFADDPIGAPDAPGSHERVELRRLRKLVLGGDASDCVYIGDHLEFPSLSQVRISFHFCTLAEEEANPLIRRTLSLFHNKPEGTNVTGLVAIYYEIGPEFGLQLVVHPTLYEPFPVLDVETPCDADTDLNLYFDGFPGESLSGPMRTAYRALPPSFAHTLLLQTSDLEMWRDVIEYFPRTVHLILPDNDTAALACLSLLVPPEDQAPEPLLELETLEVWGVRLRESHVAPRRPIRRLVLKGCPAYDDDVDALRRLVGQVEVLW